MKVTYRSGPHGTEGIHRLRVRLHARVVYGRGSHGCRRRCWLRRVSHCPVSRLHAQAQRLRGHVAERQRRNQLLGCHGDPSLSCIFSGRISSRAMADFLDAGEIDFSRGARKASASCEKTSHGPDSRVQVSRHTTVSASVSKMSSAPGPRGPTSLRP